MIKTKNKMKSINILSFSLLSLIICLTQQQTTTQNTQTGQATQTQQLSVPVQELTQQHVSRQLTVQQQVVQQPTIQQSKSQPTILLFDFFQDQDDQQQDDQDQYQDDQDQEDQDQHKVNLNQTQNVSNQIQNDLNQTQNDSKQHLEDLYKNQLHQLNQLNQIFQIDDLNQTELPDNEVFNQTDQIYSENVQTSALLAKNIRIDSKTFSYFSLIFLIIGFYSLLVYAMQPAKRIKKYSNVIDELTEYLLIKDDNYQKKEKSNAIDF